jgi:S1-C subfamily serine protease
MTITRTLANSQAATFCIELPNSLQHGMPTPTGTGFFVSPDGYFVTAAHVITENNQSEVSCF